MNWRAVAVAAMMAGFSALPSNSVSAQEWEWLPEMTSAKLAAAGWEIKASAGMSWPDGRQSLITFWSVELEDGTSFTMRCEDNFNEFLQSTGGVCKQVAVTKD